MLLFGSNSDFDLRYGSSAVSAVYYGAVRVWPNTDYYTQIAGGAFVTTLLDAGLKRALVVSLDNAGFVPGGFSNSFSNAYNIKVFEEGSTYRLTGANLEFDAGFRVALGGGGYNVTFAPASYKRDLIFVGETGAYTLTGEALTAIRTLRAVLDAGSFSLTGADIVLGTGDGSYTSAFGNAFDGGNGASENRAFDSGFSSAYNSSTI